ncbi:hypothetical protein JCM5350_008209 [Sporobolomyces pararoseus]
MSAFGPSTRSAELPDCFASTAEVSFETAKTIYNAIGRTVPFSVTPSKESYHFFRQLRQDVLQVLESRNEGAAFVGLLCYYFRQLGMKVHSGEIASVEGFLSELHFDNHYDHAISFAHESLAEDLHPNPSEMDNARQGSAT